MTVLASVSQRTYSAGTYNLSATLAAGCMRVRITLTRVAWPAGAIASFRIERGGEMVLAGTLDGDSAEAQSWVEVLGQGRGEQPEDALPEGDYSVSVVVEQTVKTAITVEAF